MGFLAIIGHNLRHGGRRKALAQKYVCITPSVTESRSSESSTVVELLSSSETKENMDDSHLIDEGEFILQKKEEERSNDVLRHGFHEASREELSVRTRRLSSLFQRSTNDLKKMNKQRESMEVLDHTANFCAKKGNVSTSSATSKVLGNLKKNIRRITRSQARKATHSTNRNNQHEEFSPEARPFQDASRLENKDDNNEHAERRDDPAVISEVTDASHALDSSFNKRARSGHTLMTVKIVGGQALKGHHGTVVGRRGETYEVELIDDIVRKQHQSLEFIHSSSSDCMVRVLTRGLLFGRRGLVTGDFNKALYNVKLIDKVVLIPTRHVERIRRPTNIMGALKSMTGTDLASDEPAAISNESASMPLEGQISENRKAVHISAGRYRGKQGSIVGHYDKRTYKVRLTDGFIVNVRRSSIELVEADDVTKQPLALHETRVSPLCKEEQRSLLRDLGVEVEITAGANTGRLGSIVGNVDKRTYTVQLRDGSKINVRHSSVIPLNKVNRSLVPPADDRSSAPLDPDDSEDSLSSLLSRSSTASSMATTSRHPVKRGRQSSRGQSLTRLASSRSVSRRSCSRSRVKPTSSNIQMEAHFPELYWSNKKSKLVEVSVVL